MLKSPKFGKGFIWLIVASFVFFAVVLSYNIISAYTYDTSTINPKVIHEWKIIGGSPVNAEGMYFFVAKNPDPEHPVQYVLFEIYEPAGRMLFRFLYYEKGELMVYRAVGRGHYQKRVPTNVDREDARQWLDPAKLYDDYEQRKEEM